MRFGYNPLSCHHSDVPDTQPLHWGKGDFGIRAGIIAAIIAAIIAGIDYEITAAIALTQTATIVKTVNAVVSAEVVQGQGVLNQYLYCVIHILQQYIDLLAEKLAIVRYMSPLLYGPRFHLICLTPYEVHNATKAQHSWLNILKVHAHSNSSSILCF